MDLEHKGIKYAIYKNNNDNNKALITKFWGWIWILNKLVKVGHVYSFPPFLFHLKLYFLLLP